jgi:hypothetical protein
MAQPRTFIRAHPQTKDQLRQMLADAVRNTQPELNAPKVLPVSEPEAKRQALRNSRRPAKKHPAKRLSKGRKERA